MALQKIVKLVYPTFPCNRGSLGLLLLRVVFGLGIAMHGYGKLGDIAGFAEGVGVPYILGLMAVLTEFTGGILLMLGILTPLVAVMLVGNMAVAAMKHISGGDPFLLQAGADGYSYGWEFATLYLIGFACVALNGPGKFSVDYLALKKLKSE